MKPLIALFSLVAVFLALHETGEAAATSFMANPDTAFAIVHVTVIDGLGSAPKRDYSVFVKDGRIAAIGPSARNPLPVGMWAFSGVGKTLMPGIVGMHEHLYYEMSPASISAPTMLVSAPKLYLAAGVTTARTTGSFETYGELNLKQRIASGEEPGPDLDVTGPYLSGPNDPLIIQQAALTSPQDARSTVDFWTAHGVTSFKAFLALTRDELAATIDEAHAHGALVTGHLCSITMSEAADLGIDQLEHGIMQASDFVPGKQPDVCPPFSVLAKSWSSLSPDDPRIAALIAKLVAHHVAVTSTLAVLESDLGLAAPLDTRKLSLLDDDARAGYELERKQDSGIAADIGSHILTNEMSFERAFVRAGGVLAAGADAGVGVLPGFADQREIELLAAAGFTPVETIQIASANGARAMRRFDRVGSIETGKAADLLLVSGDLASDIKAIEHPVLVVRAGRAYDPQKLIDACVGKLGRE